jgi:Condensation domain
MILKRRYLTGWARSLRLDGSDNDERREMIGASGLEAVDVRRDRLMAQLRERNAHCRAFPMSFQQRGIWFIEQLHPGTAAYHVPLALEFPEPRDPDTVQRAVNAVVAHHPALRTTFGVDGLTFEPIQRVHTRIDVPLHRSDLSALPEPQARVRQLSRRHATTPFDLEDGPLIRAHLLELPGRRQRLLVTLHHLIADGWSLHLLMRDLEAAHDALSRRQAPPLRRPPRDYHDWSVWQRDRAAGSWQPHLDFYGDVLRGSPSRLELPADRPRPAAPTLAAGRHELTIPGCVLADLHARARRAGTTLYAVLLAALAVILHRRTGQDQVVIGTPMANRAHPAMQEVVGYFVNIGVIPVTVTADDTVTSLLRQVHQLMLSALSFQDLPFERLVEALAPERSRAVHPIFQVMLALQNTPDAWETERQQEPTGAAKFDLTFNAVEAPGGLRLDCVYAAELFDPATVVGLCDEFTRVLATGSAA